MIIEMKKADVIKLLKAEKRLTRGMWIYGNSNIPSRCSVCAVGAIVRRMLATTVSVEAVEGLAGHMAGYYIGYDSRLRQLSEVYEAAAREAAGVFHDWTAGTAEGMKAAIAHIRTNWPATIRFDIGDARPRRGMKIVERRAP